MLLRATVAAVSALAFLVGERHAFAEETPNASPATAIFALIVGSNQSVDTELAPLKYADDDAARYLDLFRLLGARTYLLTRLDDNTRRLHPQAAAEAQEPRHAQLERALAQLASDVALASSRSVETVVYFVYAGHGNVKNGEGYLTLEDARVSGGDLAQMIRRIPATRVHVIADACASFFLARTRGPGGTRRPLEGFRASALADDARVGLLLSTSSARESHEWDAFQSGVFSHEVRSGLYGAADADGDGVVSYREIAAFVTRANAAVPNERYRPDVFARAPIASDALVDIRKGLGRKLVIDGKQAAHYFVEDGRGVRLADVHNAPGQRVELVRPSPNTTVYLRRVADDKEFVLDAAPEVVALADLAPNAPRSQSRGAAHEAFNLLFALPFDSETVSKYVAAVPAEVLSPEMSPGDKTGSRDPAGRTRRNIGLAGLAVGTVGLGLGTYFSIAAMNRSASGGPAASQAAIVERNERIAAENTAAVVSFVAGGILVGAGAALVLWPSPRGVRAAAIPGQGAFVGYEASF